MRPIRWVVVHTSATADKSGKPVDASAESIRRYHVEHNGWKDIGYHYVVRMNGLLEGGRPLPDVGAHVGGFNDESVGICCSGHGDIEDFTPQQHQVLSALCAQLCVSLGLPHTAVIGHREADDHGAPHVDKTCPGTKVDMDVVRANVQAQLAQPGAQLAALERRVAALEARATG
jgi:N-acetylmuramoyl-L-alanine amidase